FYPPTAGHEPPLPVAGRPSGHLTKNDHSQTLPRALDVEAVTVHDNRIRRPAYATFLIAVFEGEGGACFRQGSDVLQLVLAAGAAVDAGLVVGAVKHELPESLFLGDRCSGL